MKKVLTILIILVVSLSFAFAGGSKESKPLTVWVMGAGAQVDALKAAADGFTAETGIQVDFSAPGNDYESLLQTKMASGDMPDVFDTSGWSLRRYKEFLSPLNGKSFTNNISEAAMNTIKDSDGKFYVLPFDTDLSGIIYNTDVLKEAGVNVDEILTWDDFSAACAKIKAIGKTPISCGASSVFTVGWIYDRLAPSFFVTGKENRVDDLLSGKLDEAQWIKMNALVDSWLKNGYFNKDVVSGDFMGDLNGLVANEVGFVFIQNVAISMTGAKNLGLMPLPAVNKEDGVSMISSVNIALGISKNSKNKANAEKFLEYLSRDEVAASIASSTGNVPALTNAKVDLGPVQSYIDKYQSVPTYDFFDRIYLPSGIWDTICSEGQNVLAGKSGAVESTAKQIKATFDSLF